MDGWIDGSLGGCIDTLIGGYIEINEERNKGK
jgi:hypothetical protein